MQAEEAQKELEELKTKNAVAEQTSQSDAVALRERVESAEKERDEVTGQLGSVEAEKNEAVKKAKDLEQRSHELHERLVTVTEVRSNIVLTRVLNKSHDRTALPTLTQATGQYSSHQYVVKIHKNIERK